eukprot:scaffold527_cov368-Prasinococcus_capsulatus_cf.AAC.13
MAPQKFPLSSSSETMGSAYRHGARSLKGLVFHTCAFFASMTSESRLTHLLGRAADNGKQIKEAC